MTDSKTVVPANAKKPTDRKPKDSDDLTVTVSGRDWTVAKDALDDFELLDDMNALEQREDGSRLPSIMRRLLGDDQTRAAMNTLRNEGTGRVSVEAGAGFVKDVLEALNPNS